QRERDPADDLDWPLAQEQGGTEAPHLQGGLGLGHPEPLRRGSRTSRRPSPSTFSPRTRSTMTTPGMVLLQWFSSMYPLPSAIIWPRLGSGGCAPMPMNESPASAMIAMAV